jgi:hypothetical protein
MRFMLMIYPGPQEGAWEVTREDAEAMNRYNEALSRAGVLLALDGLHPDTKGARVRFSGGGKTVTDGPFTEAKEIVGGYWIIQAKSKEEAVEWATRVPIGEGDMVEVRQIAELTDFAEDIQEVAGLSQEPPAQTRAE